MVAGEGPDSGVRRERASTRDPDVAFEWMRNAYTDHAPQIYGDPGQFQFVSASASAGWVQLTEMRHSMGFVGPSQPADKVIVMAPRSGTRMRITCEARDVVEPLMLAPMWASFVGQWDDMDLQTVNLDLGRVGDYAEHMYGTAANELTFSDVSPISPPLARYWHAAVEHITRDVFANPWASTQPIVVRKAFHTLAAAVLAVFPNSALAAATDLDGPQRRGAVSAAVSDQVADFVRNHADDALGPADVAAVADAPYRDVVAGMRRHKGAHPAELLWQARLLGVYRSLLASDPEIDTVAGIAARWGFTRASNFAVVYLAAVGETPEQTLRR